MKKNVYQMVVVRLNLLLFCLLLTAVLSGALAQSGIQTSTDVLLTGQVRGEDGQGIPGVSVLLKSTRPDGSATGTTTDVDGRYQIRAGKGATLVFSFLGYTSKELTVGSASSIDVTLEPNEQSLDEVVVVGYGTQRRRDVTGAISTVSSQQIQQVPVTNVVQALQGRAPGVDIATNDYGPGESAAIRIRGNRSFRASNEPLFVVDGVPLAGGNLNDFNPGDIESLEVLKDASATAIYGSRGANGVILITTKRGKAGKTSITYDGFYGIQSPSKRLRLMNGAEFVEMNREAYRNRSTGFVYKSPTPNRLEDSTMFAGLDFYAWQTVRNAYDPDGSYHPERIRTTDWPDLMLQSTALQSHQISISGGNDKTRFLLSGAYFGDNGIMKGKDFNRYTSRFNLDHQLSTRVRVGFSTTFAYSIQNRGTNIYYQASRVIPIAVPRDSLGALIFNPGNDAFTYNPIYDFDGVIREERNTRFFGSLYAELDLLKGLKYRVNFGPDFSLTRNGVFFASLSSEGKGGAASAQYNQGNRFGYTLENLLFYNRRFNEKHELNLTALQSVQDERAERSGNSVNGLPYEYQEFYNVGTAENIVGVSSNFSRWRLLSYMGRVNYNFAGKYYLTLTGRWDGSSRLAPGRKFSFFPSASLAYNLSEEPFMRGITFLDELKFRVGYGQTGNTSIDPYQTQGSLSRTIYSWDEVPAFGFQPGDIRNPNLFWERTAAANVGLDFSLFKGRLSGSLNLYRSNTYDLLLQDQLPTASGFSSYLRNVGSTRNQGVELNLSTVNVRSAGGFGWTTDWVFSRNREAIVELYKGKVDDLGNRWFIGQPLGVYYDYQFERIWQNTPEDIELMKAFNDKGRNGFRPGDIKVVDVNGDGIINTADQTIVGNDRPRYIASLTNTFTYKGLELSVFAYTRQGLMYGTDLYNLSAFLSGRVNHVRVDYWTPTNTSGTFPRPSDRERPLYSSSLRYVDGSFVRIRTATLAYTLPSAITNRLKMNRLRVYTTVDNPFIWTRNRDILDPEGAGAAETPNRIAFIFGLNLGL